MVFRHLAKENVQTLNSYMWCSTSPMAAFVVG